MGVVRRVLLVLAGFALTSGAYGSQSEPLNEKEETRLIDFVIDETGISVWQVISTVSTGAHPPFATATVVFEPTETSDACLARVMHLSTNADADGSFNWSSAPRKGISYMLWFTRCESADVYEAILLPELIGFDVLEQIRDESAAILDDAYAILEHDRTGARPDPRLSEISLRYDPGHGSVFDIRYRIQDCLWISADVVLEADGARVLDAGLAMC